MCSYYKNLVDFYSTKLLLLRHSTIANLARNRGEFLIRFRAYKKCPAHMELGKNGTKDEQKSNSQQVYRKLVDVLVYNPLPLKLKFK